MKVDLNKLDEFIALYNAKEHDLLFNKDFNSFVGEIVVSDNDERTTYLVQDGIERIMDKKSNLTETSFFDFGEQNAYSSSDDNGTPEGSSLVNPNEQMPTFTVGGDFNKTVHQRIGDRRFVFKTYKNNYLGFYRSIGIEGKFQRLRSAWFVSWWGQSFASEMTVGCDNMNLSTSHVFPTPQNYNTLARPSFKGVSKYIIGNHNFDIVGIDINLSAGIFGQTYTLKTDNINTLISNKLNSVIGNVFDDKFAKVVDDIANSFDPGFKTRHANHAMNVARIADQNRLTFNNGYVTKDMGYTDKNEWWFDKNAGIFLGVGGDGKVVIGPNTYSYDMKSGSFFGKARLGTTYWKYRIVKI